MFPGSTATVGGSVKGTRARTLLLVVARMPKSVEAYETEKPFCFMAMDGVTKTLRVELEAEIGIKTPDLPFADNSTEKDVTDTLSLTCEAKATVSGQLGYEGVWMKAHDPHPNYYSSIDDSWLKSDFAAMLGPGSKPQIKAKIEKWFDEDTRLAPFKPKKSTWRRIRSAGIPFAHLDKGLRDALRYVYEERSEFSARFRSELERKATHHLMTIRAFKEYDVDYFFGVTAKHAREKYKHVVNGKALDRLGIADYRFERDSRLCFVDLVSHKPEASASAQAKFGGGRAGKFWQR